MREYVPDMYDAFCWHEDQAERESARYPKCDVCGGIMEDYCYEIGDLTMCQECVEDMYKRAVDIYE